jgi:predicted dienelactone hydrolase
MDVAMPRLVKLTAAILLGLAAMVSTAANARPATSSVGYEQRRIADGTEVGIWFPAAGTAQLQYIGLYEQSVVPEAKPFGRKLPLIVIAHGSGGDFRGHAHTAVALAQAGFVVTALNHPGDNRRDQSRATDLAARPAALRRLVDFMLTDWPSRGALNPARIGAFGFSAGGFTVLAALGATADLARIEQHCVDHPQLFDCRLIKASAGKRMPWMATADARIKAAVIAAPALGFTFDPAGMRLTTRPIQLWRADADEVLPAPYYADAVRSALPRRPEFRRVAGAGHFDFLDVCKIASGPAAICRSADGFDRAAFHRDFDAQVVRFFRQKLR